MAEKTGKLTGGSLSLPMNFTRVSKLQFTIFTPLLFARLLPAVLLCSVNHFGLVALCPNL